MDNFIGQYKIDKKICESLIKFFNKNKKTWCKGALGYVTDEKIKKSTDLSFSANHNDPSVKKYFNSLSKSLEEYKKQYSMCDKHQWTWGITECVNIQRYLPKEGFYDYHCENQGDFVSRNRHLVFMTYLNDVKNAGTEFLYQKTKFKAEQGSTLIWPSAWTHTHRGVISKKETKYIITGWYSYYNNNEKT